MARRRCSSAALRRAAAAIFQKRKNARPTAARARQLGQFDSLNSGVTALRRRLENVVQSTAVRRWCIYEWFYASSDYPFFSNSEFNSLLLELGEANVG